ncbi:HU family DNA-binding protein [Bacteroides xylanisolvens]|nr:HU family DNA-binding protein [Bacteroides xylanisolvens]
MTATLEELKYEVAQCLKEGKKVHIDGLGYLQVTLSCEEEIRDPKDKRVHKVKLKAIKFKADKELKAELSDMEFHRSKYRPHSAGLSGSGDRYGIDKVFCRKPTYHPKRLPVPLRNDTNYCIPPY